MDSDEPNKLVESDECEIWRKDGISLIWRTAQNKFLCFIQLGVQIWQIWQILKSKILQIDIQTWQICWIFCWPSLCLLSKKTDIKSRNPMRHLLRRLTRANRETPRDSNRRLIRCRLTKQSTVALMSMQVESNGPLARMANLLSCSPLLASLTLITRSLAHSFYIQISGGSET